MPATKVQLVGGPFEDAEGNVLSLGYLEMKLNQDESVSGVGQIAAGITVRIDLDVNGIVVASPAQSVWGNDQMLPINSYYRVKGFDNRGQLSWGPNNQQVNGSGGTFDVGSWIPNVVLSWFPSLQNLVLETNGSANDVQSLQNLEDSDTVTFTYEGSGAVKAHAASSTPSGPTAATTFSQRMFKANPNTSGLSGAASFGSQPSNVGQGESVGTSFLVANADSPAPDTIYVGIQTTTATPSSSGWSLMDNISYFVPPARGNAYTLNNLKVAKWRCRVIDTADVRLWLTISDIYGTLRNNMDAALPTGIQLFGFRYDTSAGDTHWQAMTSDGSGGNTVVDTGITPVINQSATFAIDISPTSLKFYINGTLVATITTHIMSTATYIGDLFRVDNINMANVKGFAINEVILVEAY